MPATGIEPFLSKKYTLKKGDFYPLINSAPLYAPLALSATQPYIYNICTHLPLSSMHENIDLHVLKCYYSYI